MEDKSDHVIVLSDSETEILTRALVEAAKEKPLPKAVQHTELKKKPKPPVAPATETGFLY